MAQLAFVGKGAVQIGRFDEMDERLSYALANRLGELAKEERERQVELAGAVVEALGRVTMAAAGMVAETVARKQL